jgi:hypothetical protein
VLAGVPMLVLAVAALAGYPLITGDDLVQNFPLEELSGRIIASGHMPLFDSYLWSGTPLLGGTNAHSFLPITFLFVVLSPLAAWVLGEALVLGLAAVGAQLLLRRTGCSTLAASLGGATFGLGGFFSSQVVHIDFASAAVSLPWALVALDGLARRAGDSRPRHALLLAAAAAWLSFAGSPDIVIDCVVACGFYAIHLLLQPAGGADVRRVAGRASFLCWAAVGTLAGVAVGAIQWLTAARFVSVSQRAHPALAFISGGSLTGANFLELLVPHVLGGGSFGVHSFGGTFPLAEIDGYPGTLALVATFAMLAAVRRADAWRWRVWLAIAGAGLLIAAGDHTPLERLLAHLPITGSERLPSRALILVALAAAMLLGHFVDDLLESRLSRAQCIAGAVPLIGISAVILATLVTGKPAGGALTAHGHGWSVTGVLPYFALSAVLAAGAAVLLFYRGRLTSRRLALAVMALVVVDLATFDANQSSLVPSYSSQLSPVLSQQIKALIGDDRYIVIDPGLQGGRSLDDVAGPDLGAIEGLPNAGGYGSLMWGPYSAATGTHAQAGATAAAFANGTFVSLGVGAVLVWHDAVTAGLARDLAAGGWKRRPAALAGFYVYQNSHVAPPFRLTAAQARLSVVSTSGDTGAATVRVTSPRATTLVRAVADVPGWQVTISHDGHTTSSAPRRDGLVQSVRLSAGTSSVAFNYQAPGWVASQLTALGGAVVIVGLVGLDAFYRRRQRRSARYTEENRVGRVGFEPTKAEPADLQSAPVVHLGTDPRSDTIYDPD